MRVLIVIQSFLPYGSAVNKLILNLIRSEAFMKKGIVCDILTLKGQYNDAGHENVDGIYIYRLENEDSYPIKQCIKYCKDVRGIKTLLTKIAFKVCFSKDGSLNTIISKRISAFLNQHGENYDIIMPVSGRPEMADGFRMYAETKYEWGKGLLYQVDPMADNEAFDRSLRSKMESLERLLYQSMGFVFTTPIIYNANKLAGYNVNNVQGIEFPTISYKNNHELNGSCLYQQANEKTINCVFTGYLHRKLRSPQYTLELFSHIRSNDIHLYIAGKGYEEMITKYCTESTGQQIHYVGNLPPEESLRLQDQSDFLVNIGNTCTNMVPSKVFEYINTGKPIINICKNHDCPSLRYYTRYPLVLNLFEDASDMTLEVQKLKDFITRNKGRVISQHEIIDLYPECAIEKVSSDISMRMQQMVGG